MLVRLFLSALRFSFLLLLLPFSLSASLSSCGFPSGVLYVLHDPPPPLVSPALLQHSGIQDAETGNWEAHPCPVQPTPNPCRTVPWAELMRSGETLAGGGQSGPSILGCADGWSPDSNHRMRTGWRRSCLRPCCLASPGVPPSPLLLAPRCSQNSGFKKARCFQVKSVQSFIGLSPQDTGLYFEFFLNPHWICNS